MIRAPAPYPHAGSFAAFIDTDVPRPEDRRAELVRIARIEAGGTAFITFPLRGAASGSRTLTLDELIDCTPLTHDEQRELTDLQLALKGRKLRTAKQQQSMFRAERLKERLLYAQLMAPELGKLDRQASRGITAAARGRTASRGQIIDTRAHHGATAPHRA